MPEIYIDVSRLSDYSGSTIELTVTETTTLKQLKDMIRGKTNIEITNQRLFSTGDISLELNDDKLLSNFTDVFAGTKYISAVDLKDDRVPTYASTLTGADCLLWYWIDDINVPADAHKFIQIINSSTEMELLAKKETEFDDFFNVGQIQGSFRNEVRSRIKEMQDKANSNSLEMYLKDIYEHISPEELTRLDLNVAHATVTDVTDSVNFKTGTLTITSCPHTLHKALEAIVDTESKHPRLSNSKRLEVLGQSITFIGIR
eukprot:776399_1